LQIKNPGLDSAVHKFKVPGSGFRKLGLGKTIKLCLKLAEAGQFCLARLGRKVLELGVVLMKSRSRGGRRMKLKIRIEIPVNQSVEITGNRLGGT